MSATHPHRDRTRRRLAVAAGVLMVFILVAVPSAQAQEKSIWEKVWEYMQAGAAIPVAPGVGVAWKALNDAGPEAVLKGADIAAGVVSKPFTLVGQAIMLVAAEVAGLAVTLAGLALDYVLQVSKFATNPWVTAGWTFTRDALNFFFILALLAIAFATIAGIEGYGMKRLLPRLLVAALLVNFSLAISGALVGFSQTAVRTLIGTAGGTAAGATLSTRLANTSIVNRLYIYQPGTLLPITVSEEGGRSWGSLLYSEQFKAMARSLFAVAMMMIVAITIGAVTLTLFIRIVALYVLLILSPAAYVFSVLPQTAGYAKQWWDAFMKYLLYGPVVVFFLMLAVRIGARPSTRPGALPGEEELNLQTLSGQLGITGDNIVEDFFLKSQLFGDIVQSAFVVLFIIIALMVASKMGIAGAAITTSAAGLISRVPRGAVGAGLFAGRPILRSTGLEGLYKGVKEGLDTRRKLAEERVSLGTAARVGGVFGTVGDQQARARLTERKAIEQSKVYEQDNIGQDATRALLKSANPVEARAAAIYGQKKEYFENAEDYRAGLAAVAKGSSVEKDIQKQFDKFSPILARTKLTEDQLKDYGAGPLFQREVQQAIAAGREDIQKALNKATAEDVAKWSGSLVGIILDTKLDLGVSRVNAILRSGRTEAKEQILEAYEKQTGRKGTLPKPGPAGLTPAEVKAIGKIV